MVTAASRRGKEPEPGIACRSLFEQGPTFEIDPAPPFELEVDPSAGAQALAGLQGAERSGEKIRRERRVEKDNIPLARRSSSEIRALRRSAFEEGERRLPAYRAVRSPEPVGVVAQRPNRSLMALHQNKAARSPGQRLESQGAAAGEQVEAVAALDLAG